MEIRIDGKELKNNIDIAAAAMEKKPSWDALNHIMIETLENKIVIFVTDCDKFVEIYIDAEIVEPGKIVLDKEDIKVILKSDDYITIKTTDGNKVAVVTSKKTTTATNYEDELPKKPETESEEIAGSFDATFLRETLESADVFAAKESNNKTLTCINFNFNRERVESLDGHRVLLRDFEKDTDFSGNVLLFSNAVPFFKKLLKTYSTEKVFVSNSEKYITFYNNRFKYTQRKIDGDFFNVDKCMQNDYEYRIVSSTKELLRVTKESVDLIKATKDEKTPIVFHNVDGNINAATITRKYESLEKLEVDNANMANDFCIAFNPAYINDAMKIIDTDNAFITFTSSNAPAVIYGKTYKFLILPVAAPGVIDKIKAIERNM